MHSISPHPQLPARAAKAAHSAGPHRLRCLCKACYELRRSLGRHAWVLLTMLMRHLVARPAASAGSPGSGFNKAATGIYCVHRWRRRAYCLWLLNACACKARLEVRVSQLTATVHTFVTTAGQRYCGTAVKMRELDCTKSALLDYLRLRLFM